MGRILNIEIKESEKALKKLMHQQDKGRKKERIDVLYLLTSHQAKTSLEVSRLVGRDYSTVKRWLRRYRQGGIKKLLEIKHQGGKSLSLPKKVLEALDQRLGDPNGFENYRAIQVWLEANYGLTINYSTLYGIVHHRLKAKPKVVRPPSAKRDESKAIEFNKKKAWRLSVIATRFHTDNQRIRYWCADESRFGLKTITRRRLTKRGVKPIGKVQWAFQAYYLYGMVEPLTGENWFWECSHLNTDCFEAYLSEFSQAYPDDLHIIQLDNARFHTAKRLVIPHNLRLWFQPPHAPEGNPIERLWAYLKGRLSWKLFDGLDQLQDHLATLITQISNEILASITGKSALCSALSYFNSCYLYKG